LRQLNVLAYEVRCSLQIHDAYAALKSKGFPYSLPSVGPGADPGVQGVSPQVIISHPPGGRLPLRSARPVVTFPAAEHHRPLVGTKLYCLVTSCATTLGKLFTLMFIGVNNLPKVVMQLCTK